MSWARDLLRGDGARADQPRDLLIERLRRDPRISGDAVEAIARVQREFFVPEHRRELAYEDVALEIGPVATISAPSMVAEMLTALNLSAGLSVLEIGGGSGYAAATIAAYGDRVVSLEVQPELAQQARQNLERAGFKDLVRTVTADGRWGWAESAPYDRILVSASVDAVPQAWLDQMAERGILVYPESGQGEDLLVRLKRAPTGLTREILGRCRFVRMQL